MASFKYLFELFKITQYEQSLFTFLSFLLFAFVLSKSGGFHELLNDLLFLDLILKHEFLPLFIKLCFSNLSSLFLQDCALLGSILSQVHLSELLVLIPHALSFSPLFKSFTIELCFVTFEVKLDLTRIIHAEVVAGEVEVNQRVIMLKLFTEHLTTLLVQVVVSEIEREQSLVMVETLYKLIHSPRLLTTNC